MSTQMLQKTKQERRREREHICDNSPGVPYDEDYSEGKAHCFAWSYFHPHCQVVPVGGVGGTTGVYLVCLDCRVAGELSQVGTRLDAGSCCLPRPAKKE